MVRKTGPGCILEKKMHFESFKKKVEASNEKLKLKNTIFRFQ